jgi:hypothetical protein
MIELRRYESDLSSSVEIWSEFRQRGIDYFRDVEHSVGPSIEAIEKTFSSLRNAGRRVEYMMKELNQDHPQGVGYNALPSFNIKCCNLVTEYH